MKQVEWAGPLFYPPVGMIAVLNDGERIEVWACEYDAVDCFTGLMLLDGRSRGQIIARDLSCMWDRTKIHHIEEPTEDDLRLGMWPRQAVAQ